MPAVRKLKVPFPRRLETRIGVAIILAISAILVLALVQLLLIPHGKFTVLQRPWLIETVKSIVARVSATAPLERQRLIDDFPERQWFLIEWSDMEPLTSQRPRPPPHLDQRLEHDLRIALDGAHTLSVSLMRHRGPRPRDRSHAGLNSEPGDAALERVPHVLTVIPSPAADGQAYSHADLVPAIFDIKMQLADGSWLHITPKQSANYGWLLDLLLPLIGGTVVIVVLSIFTSRRILAPLNALTKTAQRLGMERNVTPIPTEGLEEFASVANALNDMHARLSGFVEERTQMLAAISHDIRTALTRLSLSVEEVGNAELKASLNDEIAEMEAMISATLAFAGNDARSEPATEVDLAALLISLTDEETDKGRSASYVGPDHLVLRCQRLSIKRALINVIDNAIKYGERVEVRLTSGAARAEILVRDWGPGIAESLRDKAFAPFQRLESSRSRNTGGVGLGLSIARDAIRAHMGRIELGDAQGGGLCVRIELPV